MPVMANVRDALEAEAGEQMTGLKAIVKAVFRHATWGKGAKSGTVQSGYLKDIVTDAEIKFKAWNREDLSGLKGEQIMAYAKNGPRGVSGIKIGTDQNKDGQPELCVEFSEKAEIETNDGPPSDGPDEDEDEVPDAPAPARAAEPARSSAPAPAPRRATAPVAPAPAKAHGGAPAKGDVTWTIVGAEVRRVAALYTACVVEVVGQVVPAVANRTSLIIDDQNTIHAAATTIMLTVLRDADKLWRIPGFPWKGYTTPAPAPQPAEPAGPDVGDGDNLP